MKRNCSIVRDLLPSYIEELVSNETKKYVENHLEKCTECKQVLKEMKRDNTEEFNVTPETEAEIRIIKKHRRVRIISKITTIVLLTILLTSFISFGIAFVPINSVREKAYNKLQELKQLDNYKLTIEKTEKVGDGITNIGTITYYYKYGNYKEDYVNNVTYNYMNGEYIEKGIEQNGEHRISYYSDGISNVITIDEQNGNVTVSKTASNFEKGKNLEDMCPILLQYSKDLSSKISMTKVIDLREDTYNEINYYVLTQYYSEMKTMYEYWINKETMMIDRKISKQENTAYVDEKYKYNISEYKYILEPNVVTNEDVAVPYDDLIEPQYHLLN